MKNERTYTKDEILTALQAAVQKDRENCSRFATANVGNADAIRQRLRDSQVFISAVNAVSDELTRL